MFHGIPKVESNIYFFRLECPNDAKFSFNNGVNIVSQEGGNGLKAFVPLLPWTFADSSCLHIFPVHPFIFLIFLIHHTDLPPPQLTHLRQRTAGNQVELQCSVPMPCPALPPSLRWLPRDDSRKEQTEVVQVRSSPWMNSFKVSTTLVHQFQVDVQYVKH